MNGLFRCASVGKLFHGEQFALPTNNVTAVWGGSAEHTSAEAGTRTHS